MRKLKAITAIAIMVVAVAFGSVAQSTGDGIQCRATTAKGTQCRRKAVTSDGYCKQHSPATFRCGAIKADGTPCKAIVKSFGERCHNHQY